MTIKELGGGPPKELKKSQLQSGNGEVALYILPAAWLHGLGGSGAPGSGATSVLPAVVPPAPAAASTADGPLAPAPRGSAAIAACLGFLNSHRPQDLAIDLMASHDALTIHA